MVSSSVLLVDFDASIYDTLFLSISVSSFINNFAGCRFIPDIWILIFAVTSVLLSKLLIAQKFNTKIFLHFCRCQQHGWIYCVSIVSLLECIVSEVVMSFEWSLFFSFLLSENANLRFHVQYSVLYTRTFSLCLFCFQVFCTIVDLMTLLYGSRLSAFSLYEL